jgi:hypothetical protein
MDTLSASKIRYRSAVINVSAADFLGNQIGSSAQLQLNLLNVLKHQVSIRLHMNLNGINDRMCLKKFILSSCVSSVQ